MTTTPPLSLLADLARAATSGPWSNVAPNGWSDADIAYLQAASPSVVLELVERLRVAEEHASSIPALLQNIDRLTKAINEMPEWERAVKVATSAENEKMRKAIQHHAAECDYCIVCARHPSWPEGHAPDCPATP